MKVLVLGMPRTGTQSLADALVQLGIGPVYHMREVGRNKHQALWIEALEAKFEGKGEPLDRERFDKILGSYEGVADYPAAIFPSELIAAYPEALIILSLRPEDKFYESMLSTLWHHHSNRPANDPSPMAPLANKYHQHCWENNFPQYGIQAYRKHNDLDREAAIGKKFLEYQPGDGWKPLCELLGVDVPKDEEGRERPYPRSDDWVDYKKMVKKEKTERSSAAT